MLSTSFCIYACRHITFPCHACMLCMLSHFRCVQLFATPWTTTRQAPLSMEFCRQEYWSGSPCPLPGDLPEPEIKPVSLMSPALAGGFFTTSTTWEAQNVKTIIINVMILTMTINMLNTFFTLYHLFLVFLFHFLLFLSA